MDDPRQVLGNAFQLFQQRDFAKSAAMCRQAIALGYEDADAYRLLGLALAQGGDPAAAVAAFERSCLLAPDNLDAHLNLATALRLSGRNAEAESPLRHVLARAPNHPQAFPMLRNVLRDSGRSDASHAEIFDFIYATDMWGKGSGSGSNETVTRPYREFVSGFIKDNGITSVVDVGCGDWQIGRLMDWSGIRYVGIDVSQVVLGALSEFATPNISFQSLDATVQDLPPADLLLAKDVLQHWSNEAISRFFGQLPRFRHALITNGFLPQNDGSNEDIVDGNWHSLDLRAAPFHLSGKYAFAYMADEPKRMFLWTNPAISP
jgi:tetratricopeptide (TPR) repeat protein